MTNLEKKQLEGFIAGVIQACGLMGMQGGMAEKDAVEKTKEILASLMTAYFSDVDPEIFDRALDNAIEWEKIKKEKLHTFLLSLKNKVEKELMDTAHHTSH